MVYDDVLGQLGEFGRYQRRIYFLLCLPAICCAFHKLAWVFLGAKANHRCQLPFENSSSSFDLPPDILNMSYPWDSRFGSWSSCERLDTNFTEQYFSEHQPTNVTVQCSAWIFDHSKYESSAVMEWNLVCNKAWLRASADSLFMIGVLLGSIIFGDLSDRYGRRPIFFASLVLQLVGGTLAAIAPEYVTFVISRMLIGATTSGVFLVAYVIALEMVGPSKRLFAGVACQMFFSVGYMLTAILAYVVVDWRHLQLALTLPGLIFMCYWWIIPESARWLLIKDRKNEAMEILLRVAEENKITISEDRIKELLSKEGENNCEQENKNDSTAPDSGLPLISQNGVDHEVNSDNTATSLPEKQSLTNGAQIVSNENPTEAHSPSLLDLFRHPNLRKKAFNIFFNWFANSATYYGLSWNTSNLGGNDYVNFLISGAVEIPGYTVLLLLLNRWGRKATLCSALLVAGTALLLTQLVPRDCDWMLITLAMIGKMAITASYGTVYIFTAEQFPTVIRSVGLGAASTSARIGGILAPYINLLADYWRPLPLLIFGVLSLAAGLGALQLPETLDRKLPETIEDGENFGKEKPSKSVGFKKTPETNNSTEN